MRRVPRQVWWLMRLTTFLISMKQYSTRSKRNHLTRPAFPASHPLLVYHCLSHLVRWDLSELWLRYTLTRQFRGCILARSSLHMFYQVHSRSHFKHDILYYISSKNIHASLPHQFWNCYGQFRKCESRPVWRCQVALPGNALLRILLLRTGSSTSVNFPALSGSIRWFNDDFLPS